VPARLVALAAAAAAAFAALGGLVAAGAAGGLDQWATEHAMPFAGRPAGPPSLLESLVPLLHASFRPPGAAAALLVTLPGQVVLSFLLVLAAAAVLRRRGRAEEAVSWTAAWLLATAVELVCRHLLTRPPLERDGVHVVAFDASWPSGHALRCALAAAALGAAWPRLRPVLAVWLAAACALLELAGFHTPTDVAGGLLLAAAASGGGAASAGLLRRRVALGGARPGAAA
jgi:membrane-associated phospholipid phosphatase